MTTTIYLIRHGNCQCSDRVPGRMEGVHLSENGLKQALSIVQFFKKIELDAVYSSPLDRTVETAQSLIKDKKTNLITDNNFIEIDFGNWTGMSFDQLEKDERWKQFHYFRNGCSIPGGELMVDVQTRMINGIDLIKKQHKDKSVAVFSHNDPIKSVLAFYLGISLDLFLRLTIDTGSISILKFEQDQIMIDAVNVI